MSGNNGVGLKKLVRQLVKGRAYTLVVGERAGIYDTPDDVRLGVQRLPLRPNNGVTDSVLGVPLQEGTYGFVVEDRRFPTVRGTATRHGIDYESVIRVQ